MIALLSGLFMMQASFGQPAGYVLTGSPGSGKTTLAIALELRGEVVIHETAVDVIRFYLAQGDRTPWGRPDFQERIAALQAQRESRIVPHLADARFFLDRSAIDCVAYRLVSGARPSRDLIDKVVRSHVAALRPRVFLIEGPADIERNEYRQESAEECRRIEVALVDVYARLGFDVVRVPFADLTTRLNQILRASAAEIPVDNAFSRELHERLSSARWVNELCEKWLTM